MILVVLLTLVFQIEGYSSRKNLIICTLKIFLQFKITLFFIFRTIFYHTYRNKRLNNFLMKKIMYL